MTKREWILKKIRVQKSVKRYLRLRKNSKFRTILRNQKKLSKYGVCSYKISNFKAFGFDATIVRPNFGMFIPDYVCRNEDGTPKQPKTEYQWHEQNATTPSPAAGTPVTITIITKDNHA